MLLRKIIRNRDSKSVILPAAMMRALGWNFGDYVGIDLVGKDVLTLRRVPEEKLSDAQILAANVEPIIEHA